MSDTASESKPDGEDKTSDPDVNHTDPDANHTDPDVNHTDPDVNHTDPDVTHTDQDHRGEDHYAGETSEKPGDNDLGNVDSQTELQHEDRDTDRLDTRSAESQHQDSLLGREETTKQPIKASFNEFHQYYGAPGRSVRTRTLTEKGFQYKLDQCKHQFKCSVMSHRSNITKCRNYLDNCVVDTETLEKFRSTLEHSIEDVSDSYFALAQIDKSSSDEVADTFKDCQRNNLAVRGELTHAIRAEEQDLKSKYSRSHRSSRSGSSKRTKSSSHRSMKSVASMKAEAAANAAALKAKLQYLEEESSLNCKLQKLATIRDIAVEEAKLEAFGQVVSKSSDFVSHVDNSDFGFKQTNSDAVINPEGDRQVNKHIACNDNVSVSNADCDKRDTEISNPCLMSKSVEKPKFSHSATPVVSYVPQGTHVQRVDPERSELNHEAPVFIPESCKSNYQNVPVVSESDQLSTVLKSVTDCMSVSRLPVPEPDVFEGNPLEYPSWKCAFSALIESRKVEPSDRIYYLKRFLGGDALKCVKCFLLIPTPDSYQEALSLLESRYGDKFSVAQAFKAKIESWPKVGSKNSSALREFSDFLRQCCVAAKHNQNLRVLDDESQNRLMLSKLPEWLVSRWSRQVYNYRLKYQMYPPFSEFVSFLAKEADIACDPVTSSICKPSISSSNDKGIKTLGDKTTRTCNAIQSLTCVYCSKKNHSLEKCFSLQSKSKDEKCKFIQESGLCFGCLQSGHVSKRCRNRLKCDNCGKTHPTVLHNTQSGENDETKKAKSQPSKGATKEEAKGDKQVSKHVSLCTNDQEMCRRSTMVVPVYVSSQSNSRSVLTYALLDTQSDTSFISEELCDKLAVKGTDTQLLLSTMTAENDVMHCKRVCGLNVQPFDKGVMIPLPNLFTHNGIPSNDECIPTASIADRWPYLEPMVKHLIPKRNCGVGLLIGSNCPRALTPREVIPPEDGGPFAQRTELGWGVVGPIGEPCKSSSCHSLSTTSHVVMRTTSKEMFSPKDIVEFFRREETGDIAGKGLSCDDQKFFSMMTQGIRKCEDGHYEMPLPL